MDTVYVWSTMAYVIHICIAFIYKPTLTQKVSLAAYAYFAFFPVCKALRAHTQMPFPHYFCTVLYKVHEVTPRPNLYRTASYTRF